MSPFILAFQASLSILPYEDRPKNLSDLIAFDYPVYSPNTTIFQDFENSAVEIERQWYHQTVKHDSNIM